MGRSGGLVVRQEQSKTSTGETAMRQNSVGKLSGAATRLTLATILAALTVVSAGYANPSNEIVLVSPTNLPTLARQGGEAMFLHDTKDGRIFLYVEQHQGTQLAIFDVTDPARVKGEGSVQLDASGPFDFVADLGKRGELVRFREGTRPRHQGFHNSFGRLCVKTHRSGLHPRCPRHPRLQDLSERGLAQR